MALITELPVKTTLSSTDIIAVDDGNHTYQMTYGQFVSLQKQVASFTTNNGVITLTLTDGTTLTITPHDPTKQDTLTFDQVPTDGSSNPVTSNGVYDAISTEETRATEAESTLALSIGSVSTALDSKVDKETGKGLSTEDYTTEEKAKLTGIEAEANKTIVDTELSATSENPVENRAIYAALMNQEDFLIDQLDGTKNTYDTVMKKWFLLKGAEYASAEQLTALCAEWYEKTRDDWDGSVTFSIPDASGGSTGSTGTRGGDNEGLTCAPSTDSVKGQDDFEGLSLFACKDVNFIVNPDSLDILITAIDGITSNFVRDDPDIFVGVMQMSGWHYQSETATTYTHGYRTKYLAAYNDIEPLAEAVRVDGSVRQFVVHSKYMSANNSGKMTSCSGSYARPYNSHNSIHGLYAATGAQYSGTTTADDTFLKLMTMIKYASLTLDGIMNGCSNYNMQYYAQVSETDVKRIIVPSNAGILEGSTIEIGTYNGSSADRGTAANYSISGMDGVKVTAVENVTIEGNSYKAVYVDIDTPFNTVANGNAVSGSTIISTFHWACGSCDNVKGNDGSPGSNTDSKHPFRLQGIECMVGGYEVFADVIMSLEVVGSTTHYVPYITRRSSTQASSITENYEGITDLKIECPATDSWQWIKRIGFAKGMSYPVKVGGSSSTFTKDAFYMNKQGTTGLREWLAFGYLNYGALAGLSCLYGGNGLTNALWTYLRRLSPNGNRGEWAA